MIEIDADVKEMLETIMQGITSIDKRITSELSTLRQDIREVKLTIENEIKPQIRLLAEGFAAQPDLHQIASDIEDVKLDMDIVKAVVAKQSKDISKLQIVK